MKYQIYQASGEKDKQVDLNPAIFNVEANQGLIHQAVVAQMSAKRKVLADTKDKGEVRGGGRKPWRQKGTGRARHGSSRSPIWIGGGVTFGPTKDRNFKKKINKKMKRKALFMCLTDRAKSKDMVIVDKLDFKENKTKEFVAVVKNLKDVLKLKKLSKRKVAEDEKKKEEKNAGEDKKQKKFDLKKYQTSILVVTGQDTARISRLAGNIPGIKVLGANSLNVVDILAHKNILITEDSLKVITAVYLKQDSQLP
ncbi:50S ribosomal protein L4 [Candidatus Kuenenbacteria bacterium CG10_big_fil_rev_8_21_14_0_10_39_14]|nr:MAG: 50S ribosomal protein L4 [Candidatus Kuenenbacteria bacterium CG23_combo_of_CG06-09_8_20_14_all_39_39]PIP75293.1 MAG: 50S ribosomal protein L4 [Candidatus Kuenenbacteria bacterium CG22_combo_CG10-13_8_21_14_all_39_9]PIR81079.1 MAG: 50S ribosomal protein L4 [Candidatus Kuenenbacteria bacterium CG10_big_fil_rev_8_21_14_0_10_39_14]